MQGTIAFVAAGVLLGLAIFEAGCVLVFLSLAIARRPYQRIGPEPDLRARVTELQAYYDAQDVQGEHQDKELYGSQESLTLFRPSDPAVHLSLPTTGIVVIFRESYYTVPEKA